MSDPEHTSCHVLRHFLHRHIRDPVVSHLHTTYRITLDLTSRGREKERRGEDMSKVKTPLVVVVPQMTAGTRFELVKLHVLHPEVSQAQGTAPVTARRPGISRSLPIRTPEVEAGRTFEVGRRHPALLHSCQLLGIFNTSSVYKTRAYTVENAKRLDFCFPLLVPPGGTFDLLGVSYPQKSVIPIQDYTSQSPHLVEGWLQSQTKVTSKRKRRVLKK